MSRFCSKTISLSVAMAISGLTQTSVANAGMTISSHREHVSVYDDNGNYNQDETGNTNVPFSTLLTADNGSSIAKVQVDYSVSGVQTILSNGLDLTRGGGQYDGAKGQEYSMYFQVDTDTTYELSGCFYVDDVSTAGGEFVNFEAFLQEDGTTMLAHSWQQSRSTNDESFVLGSSDGDFHNVSTGSLTGTLLAGKAYRFYWNATIEALSAADFGASALGNVTLTLEDAVSSVEGVPEPASAAMWLVLGGVGVMVRRKSKKEIAS